jgi:hypothetical protein
MCAQFATLSGSGPDRSATFLRSTPENRTGSRSEVEDDAGDALEVVFILALLFRYGLVYPLRLGRSIV